MPRRAHRKVLNECKVGDDYRGSAAIGLGHQRPSRGDSNAASRGVSGATSASAARNASSSAKVACCMDAILRVCGCAILCEVHVGASRC